MEGRGGKNIKRSDSFGNGVVGLSFSPVAQQKKLLGGKSGQLLGLSPNTVRRETQKATQKDNNELVEASKLYMAYLNRNHIKDVSFDMILSEPAHFRMFLLFSETKMSAEAPRFWMRVMEFQEQSRKNPEVSASLALNILNNFLVDGAPTPVAVPSNILQRTEMAILDMGGPHVFDDCLRVARSNMTSLYPMFTSWLTTNMQRQRSPSVSSGPSMSADELAKKYPYWCVPLVSSSTTTSPRELMWSSGDPEDDPLVYEEGQMTQNGAAAADDDADDSSAAIGSSLRPKLSLPSMSVSASELQRSASQRSLQDLITPRDASSSPVLWGSTNPQPSRRLTKVGHLLGMSPTSVRKHEIQAQQSVGKRLEQESTLYRRYLIKTLRSKPDESGAHRASRLPSILTASDLPLDSILSDPVHRKTFIMFSESCLCAESVLFWQRVNEFKTIDPSEKRVMASVALNIWKNFLSQKSEKQVVLPPAVLERTRQNLLANLITSNLFDECQKETYKTIAVSVFPEYLNFLNKQPLKQGSSASTTEEEESVDSPNTARRERQLFAQMSYDKLVEEMLKQPRMDFSEEDDFDESSIVVLPEPEAQRYAMKHPSAADLMSLDDSFGPGVVGVTLSSPKPSVDGQSVDEPSQSSVNDSFGPGVEGVALSPATPKLHSKAVEAQKKPRPSSLYAVNPSGVKRFLDSRVDQFPETILHEKMLDEGKDPSNMSFEHVLADSGQKLGFRLFCSRTHSEEYLALYEKIQEFRQAKSSGDAGVIVLNIWNNFLSNEALSRVVLRHPQVVDKFKESLDQGKELSPNVLDDLQQEVVGEMRETVWPEYLSYLARLQRSRNKGNSASSSGASRRSAAAKVSAPRLPSISDCLDVNSEQFAGMLAFAEKAHCEEALLFWKAVADYQDIVPTDKAAMHEASLRIYDDFFGPEPIRGLLNVSSSLVKEIMFDLDNGLIRRDMFDGVRKEVQKLILHDIYPRFVLSVSKEPAPGNSETQSDSTSEDESPRLSADIANMINLILAGKPLEENAPFLFHQKASDVSWSSHPLFAERGPPARLDILVCSAFVTSERGLRASPTMLAVRLKILRQRDGRFRCSLMTRKKEIIARTIPGRSVRREDCLALLNAFEDVHRNDYVASFKVLVPQRRIQVEDPLFGPSTIRVAAAGDDEADADDTTTLDEDESSGAYLNYRGGYSSD